MPSEQTRPQTKREAFERALAEFYEVLIVVVDAPLLDIPARAFASAVLYAPATAILAYGLDMPKPIPDLEITDRGIFATLSFSCEPHETFVPWEAVAAIKGNGERPKQRATLKAV